MKSTVSHNLTKLGQIKDVEKICIKYLPVKNMLTVQEEINPLEKEYFKIYYHKQTIISQNQNLALLMNLTKNQI